MPKAAAGCSRRYDIWQRPRIARSFEAHMTRLLQDIRFALRGLRRSPTFTVTAILILGVGIGMAVAMVAVYDAVLLRKLPVRDQDDVAILWPYHNPGVEFPFFTTDLEKFPAIFRD